MTTAQRKLYPKNWDELRQKCLERSDHKCEICGIPNLTIGARANDGTFFTDDHILNRMSNEVFLRIFSKKVRESGFETVNVQAFLFSPEELRSVILNPKFKITYLHTAHINSQKEDDNLSNLLSLCPHCHANMDKYTTQEKAKITREHKSLQHKTFVISQMRQTAMQL